MQVTRIVSPVVAQQGNAPAAPLAAPDRHARLNAIRTELRDAVAFTAKAHHGWGGPFPTPAPTPAPAPAPPAAE